MPVDSTKIRRGFVPRGTFVAMPLAFPSVTVPIEPEASHVSALCYMTLGGGTVLGGTSGTAAHLFMACTRPPYGYVLDLGRVPEAESVVSLVHVSTDKEKQEILVAAAVNRPAGGRVIRVRETLRFPDGIQEWSFARPEQEVLADLPGEPLLDMCLLDGELLCLTEKRVLLMSVADDAPVAFDGDPIGPLAIPRLGMSASGAVLLAADDGRMLGVDTSTRTVKATETGGPFKAGSAGWAKGPDDLLIAADHEGCLYRVTSRGEADRIAQTLLTPVKAMACLPDGRIYGLCGDGIGRFFYADPEADTVEDYGPIAAVYGAKRYAYTFGCAAVGQDGEIYFGEDDRGGHLWTYFPPLD